LCCPSQEDSLPDEVDRKRAPGTVVCLPKNWVVFDKVVPVSGLAEIEAISASHCRGK
jgi:hypothetical protein